MQSFGIGEHFIFDTIRTWKGSGGIPVIDMLGAGGSTAQLRKEVK